MYQLNDTKKAIDEVLRIMPEHEYAASTIMTHRNVLNSLIKFMEKNQFTKMEEHVGLSFIKERTVVVMDGFWGKGNPKVNALLKPVQNLFYEISRKFNHLILKQFFITDFITQTKFCQPIKSLGN